MSLWLTRKDVKELLDMPAAIEAVADAFRLLYEGRTELPLRTNMPVMPYDGSLLAMPAFVGGHVNGLGVKLITLFGANPGQRGLPAIQGNFVLFDPQSGQLQAVMEAGYLTAMRTGAAGGVGTRYLARKDARTLTIFGSGMQAPYQVEAVLCERAIEQVFVLSRTQTHAATCAALLRERFGVAAEATSDTKMAVQEADILITATSAHTPLFDGSLLGPGTHITGVGSHLPSAREVDTETVRRATIVTDQTSACTSEAGDLVQPIEAGLFDPSMIHAEIGAIIAGDRPGRTDPGQITFFKSVGLAIQDVAVARVVYLKALAQGVGIQLNE